MQRLKKLLWAASTPIALCCMLAQVGAQEHGGEQAPPTDEAATREHGLEQGAVEAGEHGGHEFVTNPVENLTSFSYRDKDSHGGPYEPGDHHMPPPFTMNLVNFGAFLFLLGKYAFPGIKKATRERHDEIAKALAESGRLRDEARRRLDEYQQKMSSLDAEIAALVANIRTEAEAEKKRIIGDAEARAQRMQRDAEQQIQAEIQRVRTTLEREAVLAAVSIAEKLLQEKTNDSDQRALADKFVKGLGDAASKRRPRV